MRAERIAERPRLAKLLGKVVLVAGRVQDPVTPVARVEREYARVPAVYDRMGAPEPTEVEHFDRGHRVWSEGGFRFPHRHIKGETG